MFTTSHGYKLITKDSGQFLTEPFYLGTIGFRCPICKSEHILKLNDILEEPQYCNNCNRMFDIELSVDVKCDMKFNSRKNRNYKK